MKRVVITGLGTVNPLGSTVEKFWENIKKGTLGVSKIDSFDTTELGVSVAGIIRDFDPAEYFDRKDIRHMERFTQIAVASAIQALQDAGTDFKDMDPYRVGTIIGCGIGGIGRIEEEHDKYRAKGPGRISPFFVPMMIGNMAAGQVAIRTGFRGDNFCTTTACASATHAIGEAFRKIKDGYLDVCLCGGSESTITEFTLGGFRTMKALTTETDPAKASTPFDLNRGGFVLGEGSAVLVPARSLTPKSAQRSPLWALTSWLPASATSTASTPQTGRAWTSRLWTASTRPPTTFLWFCMAAPASPTR